MSSPSDRAGDPSLLNRLLSEPAGPDRRVLFTGATILTGRSADRPFRGDLLVEGSRIAAVGPDLGESLRTGPAPVVVPLLGMVLMPGMVDAHLHAWEGQLRGLAPDADFEGYLDLAHRTLALHYRPEDSRIGNLVTALACLDAGVTTIVDNSHNTRSHEHGLALVDGLAESGIRASHATGAPLFGDRDLDLPAHVERLAEYARNRSPLLDVRLMEGQPTAENWRLAAELGLWVSTEVVADAWMAEVGHGLTRELAEAGHTFNHCVDLSEEAWTFIADHGIQVNVCPRSDTLFGVGSAYPAVDDARAAGVRPALSSDNELSYGIDMFGEMRVLLHVHRGRRHGRLWDGHDVTHAVLTAADVLEMATVSGAANAGLASVTGSLEVGKEADLVVLDPTGPGVHAVADPVAGAVAFAHPGNVRGVLVGGEVRKWDGALVGVDVDAVRCAAESSRDHLLAAAGVASPLAGRVI